MARTPRREDAMFDARRLTVLLLAIGVAALVLGTALHPAHEDPNDTVMAFAEYAADRHWLASHLIQLAGIMAMLLGMLAVLAQNSASSDGGTAGFLLPQTALVAAGIALSAALQAVDGVALKLTLDRWSAASGAEKDLLFSASLAIRFVEIGLAAMVSLVTAMAVIAVSFSLWSLKVGGSVVGLLGMAGGLGLGASAIVMGAGGFSSAAMLINMPASILLMIWVAAHAVIHWRNRRNA
jgi:uncharacterized membrane protein (DUF2068 family)